MNNMTAMHLLLGGLLLATLAATPLCAEKAGAATAAPPTSKDLCILSGWYLIGGFGKGKWLTADEIAPLVRGGESYRRFTTTGPTGDTIGGKPVHEQGPGEWIRIPVTTWGQESGSAAGDTLSVANGPDELAVACTWNPLPRLAKSQDVNNKTYLDIVKKILQASEMPAPPRIQQLLRFDLEGKGVESVLIIAGNADPSVPVFRKNTYTLVVFRKVVAGKVQDTVLHEEYYREDKSGEANSPTGFSFGGVLDLNGDGTLELLLRSRYYEGDGVEVYTLDGDKLKLAFSNGVGA